MLENLTDLDIFNLIFVFSMGYLTGKIIWYKTFKEFLESLEDKTLLAIRQDINKNSL